jgi:hypothetical protein
MTDMIWGARVDESWRLLAVDDLLEVAVKKCVLHVQLVKRDVAMLSTDRMVVGLTIRLKVSS